MLSEPSENLEQTSPSRHYPGARFALREAVADAHARLDALYSGLDLGRRADYAAFLTSHAAAFLPVEEALDDAGAELTVPGWRQTRRSAALRSDMATLGLPLPPFATSPAFVSEARVLGGLYVLEGSRLGGAVLVRTVRAGLPAGFLAPGNPTAWRAFTAKLDARLSSPGLLGEAAAAASAVFDLFERTARAHLGSPL